MMMTERSITRRAQQALTFARQLSRTADNWLAANNALFGVGRNCTELFPDEADRAALCRIAEYREITKRLEELPRPKSKGRLRPQRSSENVNGKVLLRVPKSVHAALFAEAEAEGISLNQLCLSKLSVQLRAVV
jgi:hypothetical protein